MAKRGRGRRKRGERRQLPCSPQSTQQTALSAEQEDEQYQHLEASKFRTEVGVSPQEVPGPRKLEDLTGAPQLDNNIAGTNFQTRRGRGRPHSSSQPRVYQPVEVDQTRSEVVCGLRSVWSSMLEQHVLHSAGSTMSRRGRSSLNSLQARTETTLSPPQVEQYLEFENFIHGQKMLSGAGTCSLMKRGRGRPESFQHVQASHTTEKDGSYLSVQGESGRPRSTNLVKSPKPVQLRQSTADVDCSPVMETRSVTEMLNNVRKLVNSGSLTSFPGPSEHMNSQQLQTSELLSSSEEEDPMEEEDPEEEEDPVEEVDSMEQEDLMEQADTRKEEMLKNLGSSLSREKGQGGPSTEQQAEPTSNIEAYQPRNKVNVVSGLSHIEAQVQGQKLDTTAGASSLGKRGRGRTRNIVLERKKRAGETFSVVIPPVLRRAVGDDASLFINEAGITCRKHASLQVRKWKDIHIDVKTKMWVHLKETFNLPDDSRKAVMEQLNRMYKDWRHRLNAHYRKFQSDEERLKNRPELVSEDDWKWLVVYFGSDDFKKLSAQNKKNRENQTLRSATGTKSIARSAYELRDPNTGDLPDACLLWRATHQKRDGTWIDPQSEEIMNQLEKVAQKHQQSGSVPLPLVEHLTCVLGTRLGYVRGLGVGPKLPPGTSERCDNVQDKQDSQAQIDETQRRAEALEQEVKELKTQLAKTQEQMQAQVATEVTHRMATFFDQMTRQMWSLTNTMPQTSSSRPTTNEGERNS